MADTTQSLASVRILLVDDFEPWRRSECSILKTQKHLQVVGEVADGLTAVREAQKLNPDLILMDIGLPGLCGIEATRRICRTVPGTKIIFVTQNSDADVVRTALSNGAKGYILKEHARSELLPAVEAVLRGEEFVGKRLNH